VLELADIDLGKFLEYSQAPQGSPQRPLDASVAKAVMLHLLKGVAACHEQGVLKAETQKHAMNTVC
jgi:hypothetical protein